MVTVAAHMIGAQAVDSEEDEIERFLGHGSFLQSE
jgi:hypothetical protein